MKKVKAGGVYYKIYFAADPRSFDPNKSVDSGWAWGQTNFINRTIRLYNCPDKHEQRVTFFHELTHAIVDAYHITELSDNDGKHNESNIDLMGLGLKEALESLGIDILEYIK